MLYCKKCNRPLAEAKEGKIRTLQFPKKDGYTEIKVRHNAGGEIEIGCSCSEQNSFMRKEIALGMEYQIAKK